MGLLAIGIVFLYLSAASNCSKFYDDELPTHPERFQGSMGGPRIAHVTVVPGLTSKVHGNLVLEQESPSSPVIVRGKIYGLTDGKHGFHVHEYPELTNFCMDAGEHFNPTEDVHGAPRDLKKHVGDFGNLVSRNNEAEVYIEASEISLYSGPTSVVGRSVVVHTGEDDLGRGRNRESLKTGNSGGRAGCGVIELEGKTMRTSIHGTAAIKTPPISSAMSPNRLEHGEIFPGSFKDHTHHRTTMPSKENSLHRTSGKQHVFVLGKKYEYDFDSWMTSGIPEIAPQYSGFSLKGTLVVEPIDDVNVAFTLTKIEAKSFNEKIEGDVDPKMGKSIEIEDKSRLQQTVTLSYSDGKVIGLTSSQENTYPWIANIHKSVASQLQFQWSSESEELKQDWVVKASALFENNAVYNVREESVTGDCEVWYEISKIPSERFETSPSTVPLKSACPSKSEVFEIVKTKNFDKCKKVANFNIMSPVGMKCKPSTSGCDTTAQRTSTTRILACGPISRSGMTIQKVTTIEKVIIDPYGHDTEGLEGTSLLRLILTSVKEATGRHSRSFGGIRGDPAFTSLVYSYMPGQAPEGKALPQPSLKESTFSLMFQSLNLGKKIAPMLETVVSDLQSTEFESSPSSKFISDRMGGLRRIMSYMGYEELKESIEKILSSTSEGSISRQLLFDGMMSSGSNPSIVLTLELIEKGSLKGERALQAISMLPMVIRTPTTELLEFIVKFVSTQREESIKETGALAISQIIHHACVSKSLKKFRFPIDAMGDFCKPDEPLIINGLLPWLKSQLDYSESTSSKIVYLAALNNLAHEGVVPIVTPYIENCSGPEKRHRRSELLDFSAYKHGPLEAEELQALKTWKKLIFGEEKGEEKVKSEIVQEMKKWMDKYEENRTKNTLKILTNPDQKEFSTSKINKEVLKAIIEAAGAETDKETEQAHDKILSFLEEEGGSSMKEETPYASTEKKSSGQVEGSVPKLRKKIMKVVSLLVDAETAEDIEKAREKLQKMVDKASVKESEYEDEEGFEKEIRSSNQSGTKKEAKSEKKDSKLTAKMLEAQREYEAKLQEIKERQEYEDLLEKLEEKQRKLQLKRETRMVHDDKPLFDDGGCRVIRSKAVFALSKLAYSQNKRVLPILKSLFFNTAEDFQVRLSALTLLMASNPPLGIWERIAVGSWFDPHPDVVSFFYSSLQSISKSSNPSMRNSRTRAAAVLPLAKPAYISPSGSWNFLTGDFSDSDVLGYILQMSTFASPTSYLPDNYYTRLALQSGSGDTTLFEMSQYGRQAEKFIDAVLLGLSKAGVKDPDILSKASDALENIHKQLMIEERAAGSPEINLFVNLMESMQRIASIDHRTITKIVERMITSQFTGGIHLNYYKWLPLVDATSIIPSEAGIPFTFNSHSRMFASIKGNLKGNLLEKEIQAAISPTVTLKLYSQLAIDVPFSSRIVAAGVDTHISFSLPGVFSMGFSKATKSLTFSYEPTTSSGEPFTFTHLHVRPFTLDHKHEGSFLPMSISEDLVVVATEDKPGKRVIDYEDTFGFRYKIASMKDIGAKFGVPGPDDMLGSTLLSWLPLSLRMREYSATIDTEKSETSKIEFKFGIGKVTKRLNEEAYHPRAGRASSRTYHSHWGPITKDMESYSEGVLQKLGEGEAFMGMIDLRPKHKRSGASTRSYSMSFGLGSSSEGRKHVFNLHGKEGNTAMVCVDGSFNYPHTPAVRRETFYDMDLKTSWKLDIGFGASCKDSRVEMTGYGERSKEASRHQKQSQLYRECARLEATGLGANPECIKLRREATALDKCVMDIKYENIPPYYMNRSMQIDDMIRMSMFKYASHNPIGVNNPKGLVHIELETIPHTNLANLKMFKPSSNTFFTGIQTPTFLRSTLPLNARFGPAYTVMHPEGAPVCLIDRKHVTTFDKVNYNASLSSCNHVLAKDCSGRYKIAVLGREEEGSKVVTILASTEWMELNPSKGTIIVNDESVHLSTNPLVLETENNQLFARAFKTEDDFIVVELQPFGMTVKLNPSEIVILPSTVHKGRTCGMCGYYDNLKDAEFRGPTGCTLSSGLLMAEAYKLQRPIGISKREGRAMCSPPRSRQLEQRLEEELMSCHGGRKSHNYQPGVIKTQIADLALKPGRRSFGTGTCEKIMRTRMEERQGMICFSIEPAAACRPGCKPVGIVQQKLSFTCMPPGPKSERYTAEHYYHPLRYFENEKPMFQLLLTSPIDCRSE
ncbi:uncharacterized protein LOC136034696 isoform X1 [Artemia franciscana]|uniref:uncharacterized protein LOC136034696 isoform X1 n=1 Tax=Artemia franciscana TaxID=6661 RepID=UPI0032DAE2B2